MRARVCTLCHTYVVVIEVTANRMNSSKQTRKTIKNKQKQNSNKKLSSSDECKVLKRMRKTPQKETTVSMNWLIMGHLSSLLYGIQYVHVYYTTPNTTFGEQTETIDFIRLCSKLVPTYGACFLPLYSNGWVSQVLLYCSGSGCRNQNLYLVSLKSQ